MVGPEPESCRQLLQIEYRLEDLDRLYEQMIKSLSEKLKAPDRLTEEKAEGEIREVVRGMIQPLGSHRVVQGELRHLMQVLERYDELGSRSPTAVSIVAEALLKALSYDLRYVMLFGEADFHRLYTIHHELVAPLLAEPVHAAQREKLKQFGNRVLKWISKGHWDKHVGM